MDGGDMMEVEVYKKRREHWKKGSQRRKEGNEREVRTLREETKQYLLFIQTQSPQENLWRAGQPFVPQYKPYFSQLLSSGKALCCCLFPLLTNSIDLG